MLWCDELQQKHLHAGYSIRKFRASPKIMSSLEESLSAICINHKKNLAPNFCFQCHLLKCGSGKVCLLFTQNVNENDNYMLKHHVSGLFLNFLFSYFPAHLNFKTSGDHLEKNIFK
jgi:hypothetical protein